MTPHGVLERQYGAFAVCQCGEQFTNCPNNGDEISRWERHNQAAKILDDTEHVWGMRLHISAYESATVLVTLNEWTGEAYVRIMSDYAILTAAQSIAYTDILERAQRIAYIYNASRDVGDTEFPYYQ